MHSVFGSARTSKFWLKEGDSARCFRKHSIDRSKLNSDFRLYVHSGGTAEIGERYPTNYCTMFYFSMFNSLNQHFFRQRNTEQSPSLVNGNTNAFEVTNEKKDWYKTMFIGVINVSEKRQRTIPCLIRLQLLDCCPLSIGQSFNGILTNVLTSPYFEKIFVIPDGKFYVLGKQRVLTKPKLPKQIVKGRPQVVAGIANEQGKRGRDIFQLLKPKQALSRLSLSYKFGDGFIGFTLDESLHQVISNLQVFISSAEFEKRAIQRVHNSTPIKEVMIDAMLNISYPLVKRLEGIVDGNSFREGGNRNGS